MIAPVGSMKRWLSALPRTPQPLPWAKSSFSTGTASALKPTARHISTSAGTTSSKFG